MSATHTAPPSEVIKPSLEDDVSLKISNITYALAATPRRARKFYVQVFANKASKKTKSFRLSKNNSITWPETLPISGMSSTVLTFQVFMDPTIGRDELVAEGHTILGSLIKEEDVVLELTSKKPNERSTPAASTIQFKITPVSSEREGQTTMHQHEDATGDLDRPSSSQSQTVSIPATSEHNIAEAVDEANRHVDNIHSGKRPILNALINADTSGVGADSEQMGDILKSLLGHVQTFTTIMDTVSEVHPYTKLAWSVLSAVPKAIKHQEEVDESVVNLTQQMNDMFQLVNTASPLKTIQDNKAQIQVLAAMAQQTLECAYFIRDYCTDAGLVKRTFKHLGSSAQKSINDYSTTLNSLQSAFMAQSAVNTQISVANTQIRTAKMQISVARIMNTVEDIAPRIEAEFNMNDMPYAASAGFDPEKKCLEGTRVNIIEKICLWASGAENGDKNVMLLTGFAGSGKSTIAHSVAHRFRALRRLGSMFCFDRAIPEDRHPGSIFRTIARDLADLDAEWRQLLTPHIQTREVRTQRSPEIQFDELILAPSQGLKNTGDLLAVGPVVIIIDALDESEEWGKRDILLNILSAKTVDLPANFRILITSRAEEDIEAAFRDKSHVHHLRMSEIPSVDEDIEVFVRSRLRSLGGNPNFDLEGAAKWLTESAESLFQWANTACRFIQGERRGVDPADQLQKLKLAVSRNEALTELGALDKLYSNILFETFNMEQPEVRKRLATVMGWIVAAKEPLSKSSLRELGRLSGVDPNGNAVDLIIPSLGSLLSGVDDEHLAVIPLHTSFRDFLQKHYCHDPPQYHRQLAIGTLQTMMNCLRFNICQLESSHVPNTAVADLQNRIKNSIGILLSYACRFWAEHLCQAKYDADLACKVQSTLMGDRVLYWLEVLSLIRRVPDARRLLNLASDWLSEKDTDLRAFIADTIRFVAVFGGPIARSTPHIYISALPFAPPASLLSQTLLPRSFHRLVVKLGQLPDWPLVELEMKGQTSDITHLAFSHDGNYIASSASDQTIRVWDAATGETIAGPLKGPKVTVTSLAFSPDGTRVVSGSGDGIIRLWNVESGVITSTSGPFSKVGRSIYSVAFSPDGTRVVCGLADSMVYMWNIETAEIAGPFQGHSEPVNSVAFSHDGRRIASGSKDCTVRIWDITTGQTMASPYKKLAPPVLAVAFLPDDERLIWGSSDSTIRVWNFATGETIVCPNEGGRNVLTVAFSRDGRLAASLKADRKTIRVWEAETGINVAGPMEGELDETFCTVNIFPDGKKIATGLIALEGKIQVWNIGTRTTTASDEESNMGAVVSVAFSPDGRYLVSGTRDGTVEVWDARTGLQIPGIMMRHRRAVYSVAFSPDGRYIASGSLDKTVQVWDALEGRRKLGPLSGHTKTIRSVAFSPDGRYIASGSQNSTIRVWNAHTGRKTLKPFKGHKFWVNSVAFSPDGRYILSGSNDCTVRVWDAQTGQTILGPLKGHTNWVYSAAFSPDGKYIVSGSRDMTIRVWDAQTGQTILGPLKGHTGWVRSVSFSPDGRYIVSGSNDHIIRVWDARTGQTILDPLKGHTDWINSVALSSDGRYIASGSDDYTIRVWRIDKAQAWRERRPSTMSDYTLDPNQLMLENSNWGEDGWIIGKDGELLYWVPPWARRGLLLPTGKLIIGAPLVKLDLLGFRHGSSWQDCWSERDGVLNSQSNH